MPKKPFYIDLTGQKFHRLTVVSYHSKDSFGASKWLCKCDCGNDVILLAGNFKKKGSNATTSCGCAHSEMLVKRNLTHGDSRSKEHEAWLGAKARTTNQKHKRFGYYGGRGIQMCQRWLDSYQNFLDDMGRCPPDKRSLGRRDNDGDYEPSNCRWETHEEQMNNTRSNHVLEHNGERATIAQWARKLGLDAKEICSRLHQGWPVERVLKII